MSQAILKGSSVAALHPHGVVNVFFVLIKKSFKHLPLLYGLPLKCKMCFSHESILCSQVAILK